MHFDILFLDTTANKYYDRTTLEKHPLGGTEASVIRVAEGLGALSLKVGIAQSRVPFFEPIMGQHCFFIHADTLEKENVTCRHYVQIRGNGNSHLFPKAKKYIWLHDLSVPSMVDWIPSLDENKTKLIGVSKWHKKDIQKHTKGYLNTEYIYNPVPEDIYLKPDIELKYDPNMLVWMSSPHKGLSKAIELFQKIKIKLPKMQMTVFNPGYVQLDMINLSSIPGVIAYGPTNCYTVWAQVQRSLCVFYPGSTLETFGCIAAEANALGTPLATYKKAGLRESVSSDNQFVPDGDEEGIMNKVIQWNTEGRPKVEGKEKFKYGEVIMKWVKMLAE